MLDLTECRRILGTGCILTDAELKSLRDHLYVLAELAVSSFLAAEQRKGGGTNE